MDEHERKLWDLFSGLFVGEWPLIASIEVGRSLSTEGVKHSLTVRLTADWDVFPIQDWEQWYFGEARGSGTLEEAVENVLSQLRVSVARAREVREWHESIKQKIGRSLLIRGDGYERTPTRYRKGEDSPGGAPYVDFPALDFKAEDHVRVIALGTICTTKEWRRGYILAECEAGLIWVPAYHLKPSRLGDNGRPIAGTEHAIWI